MGLMAELASDCFVIFAPILHLNDLQVRGDPPAVPCLFLALSRLLAWPCTC